jgi:hypothetical protein
MDDCETSWYGEVSGIWATVVHGVLHGSVKSCKFRRLLFKPLKVGIGLLAMYPASSDVSSTCCELGILCDTADFESCCTGRHDKTDVSIVNTHGFPS